MAKKEKKEKVKKEKKSKKDKKEKKAKKEKEEKKSEKKHRRKGDREVLKFEISVCGDPASIALYKNRVSNTTNVDGYQVQIDADQGTDQEGRIIDKTCDLFLCVYTVADRNTVEFLEQKILPEVRALNRKYAIAGLGVENRAGNNPNEASLTTASRLAGKYGCNAMELVACDGNQLAAGTAALYYAANADVFMPQQKQHTSEQPEDGKKKKKKKKKDKKSSKGEKTKKEKTKKKKKKKNKE
ncbi:unnamed protein product [Rodentolepis nana]|uniref:Methyltransf_11 domain-containing protein n=1 Tax=Rodentolepis nana TaxID=102285 RepID=A0A0R3TTA3_RODNA|nr:unnamed protein product [Rodentolepis nana]